MGGKGALWPREVGKSSENESRETCDDRGMRDCAIFTVRCARETTQNSEKSFGEYDVLYRYAEYPPGSHQAGEGAPTKSVLRYSLILLLF